MGAFIKSEYNQVQKWTCFRSPWSNTFFPHTEEPVFPPNELRELEIKLNKLFATYCRFYYSPTSVSSVYIWDLGDSMESGFAVSCLIKNGKN